MAPPKGPRFNKECPVCGDQFGPLTTAEVARRVTCSPACGQTPRSSRSRRIEQLRRDNPAMTYEAIATEVGVTRQRVGAVLSRASGKKRD